jgi:2-oxoisovalerate dehydrogenase E2 component (dihydrolipoyl transacylase)
VPTLQQFKLPDVGEGLTEGEILQWLVAVGDTVRDGQPVVEVETAKAAVELPVPYTGVVTELLAEPGQTVAVGTPIITIDTDPGGAAAGPADATPAVQPVPEPVAEPVADGAAERERTLSSTEFVPAPKPEREAVLVGYGVMSGSVTRRPRRASSSASAAVSAAPAARTEPMAAPGAVRAKPPVRKLAKDLGVDLRLVEPTGPDGTVTREDVQQRAGGGGALAPAVGGGVGGGLERREPVKGVRKLMAEAMVRSAFTIPHVTEWLEVDATRTVKLVGRLRERPGFQEVRVTPLLLVSRAVLAAMRVVPDVNAVWDEETQEVVFPDRVNLGIAAATPRGLVVPNVKGADRLSLPELAQALTELVETAKSGKTLPGDMTGGTFTITNVGVFGIDGGTPIINPGESAILAVGAFRERPWVHKGRVKPRWVVQLALSFDHRFIDGATGARFLAAVASVLEDPAAPPAVR